MITGLTLMGMITTAWYVTQPIVLAISASIVGTGGSGESTMNLIQYATIIWGPLFDIIVLFWMIASAQARDITSEVY